MEEKKRLYVVIIVLIAILAVIGTITAYTVYDKLEYEYYVDDLEEDYGSLMNDYDTLNNYYDGLVDDYDDLLNDYNEILDDYENLYAPSTLIKNGTIHWRFYALDESVAEWTVNISSYRAYITFTKPTDYVRLKNSDTGEIYLATDIIEYVQPEFFSKVIDTLSDGRTANEFVDEVVNLKNQLITYTTGLENVHKWSAETLTEGTGNCGDTTILVASLLKAGEEKENYGLKVHIWYCDAYHMKEPQEVNHAIVGVEYLNGDYELIETTSDYYYTYDEVVGWKFEV